MVFRKPYAFLIKYFKLIHLLLTFFSIYLIVRVNSICEYFNKFIGGSITKLEAINYISSFYILVIILSIVICLIILILMKYKKKPYFLYIILIAVYLAVGFIIGISNNALGQIYNSILSTKTLLLYRDILKILVLFQYISLCFVLVRALGFDVKKFNFDEEYEKIEIVEGDDEEVELVLKDTEKYKRKIRRNFREFKYYYLENSLYINIILIVVFVILGFNFLKTLNLFGGKVYSEGDTFSSSNFGFRVDSSYISNKGYDNELISMEDNSFVVVKLDMRSIQGKNKLNRNNILLNIKDKFYSSEMSYANKFKDLGNVYTGREIGGTKYTYIFIFNVENKYLNDTMYFVYGSDIKVKLSPVELDKVGKVHEYKINEELNLSETLLGSGSININSYEISDKFTYNYTYYVRGEPYTGSLTIKSINNLILHMVISSNYPSGFDNYILLNNYGTLKYKIGEQVYESSFDNKSPSSYSEGLYVNVDKDILNAEAIWFEINLRNKQYIYKLK